MTRLGWQCNILLPNDLSELPDMATCQSYCLKVKYQTYVRE